MMVLNVTDSLLIAFDTHSAEWGGPDRDEDPLGRVTALWASGAGSPPNCSASCVGSSGVGTGNFEAPSHHSW